MEPLAPVEELTARLDWDLSDAELADAEAALDYASELVRAHGLPWPDPASAPRLARTVALAAAKRYMVNADGLVTSRAGDETVAWDGQGENAGAPYLTKAEIRMLSALGGKNVLHSVSTYAWGNRKPAVPQDASVTTSSGHTFPFISKTDPWLGVG